MTHVNAILMLQELIGTRDTVGTWNSTTMYRFLNMASRSVWNDIVWMAKGRFATDAYVTYTANAVSQAIFSGTNAAKASRIVQCLEGYAMQTAGAQSQTNEPVPMLPKSPEEIEQYQFGRLILSGETYYTVVAGNLIVRPIPSATSYFLLKMILSPTELDAATAASTELLDGLCPQAHDLICLKAAYLASLKTREVATEFQAEVQNEWMRITPFIQAVGHYPLGVRQVTADV